MFTHKYLQSHIYLTRAAEDKVCLKTHLSLIQFLHVQYNIKDSQKTWHYK